MDKILPYLIGALLKALKPETVKQALDALLDVIENKSVNSPAKWDDSIVLPLCATIRQALNVPDNDATTTTVEVKVTPPEPDA